jgi:acyl-CoA hydrolase
MSFDVLMRFYKSKDHVTYAERALVGKLIDVHAVVKQVGSTFSLTIGCRLQVLRSRRLREHV